MTHRLLIINHYIIPCIFITNNAPWTALSGNRFWIQDLSFQRMLIIFKNHFDPGRNQFLDEISGSMKNGFLQQLMQYVTSYYICWTKCRIHDLCHLVPRSRQRDAIRDVVVGQQLFMAVAYIYPRQHVYRSSKSAVDDSLMPGTPE